jgi:sugar phosphate isomerase/epimerase
MADFDSARIYCSTITLRHLPLADALAEIAGAGFQGIDLGALPGVCDHVPYELDAAAVAAVAATVSASGLVVRSVNADIGDLNVPLDGAGRVARAAHLERLLELCVAVGSRALVLPNGWLRNEPFADEAADHARVAEELVRADERSRYHGIELWLEAPHLHRLVHDVDGAQRLFELLPETIGAVCDLSHIVASAGRPRDFLDRLGSRTRHVHLRDASAGYIHHSIGRGEVDFADAFAALAAIDYPGVLALELETRDVADADRIAAAHEAARMLTGLWAASTVPTARKALA